MAITDRLRAAYRAFKLGAGIEQSRLYYGSDTSAYSPAEYGDYIATSNNVYSVVTQRAKMLASLPTKLYRMRPAGREEVETGALYELLYKVNPFWTFRRLIEMTELSLCLWGSAFWFLERGPAGRQPPREMWWGRPDRVTVIPHKDDYLAGFTYRPPDGGRPIPFAPGEVIWFRYPNPLDEYSGLSPLAAARLAADVASAAMHSNRNLFANGLQIGGAVLPKAGTTLTPEQATELEMMLDKRFRGVDKAHRWGVFRFEAQLQHIGFTPKDAEFIEALKFSLEEVCRAYHWPIDLVGGQRTYENVNAAHRAAWTHCLLPEATMIAAELTEQLLPLFPGQADEVEFDSSDIEVLHEGESDKWTRWKEQITVGARTVNQWRAEQGEDPLPWGDVWWASGGLMPIDSAEVPVRPGFGDVTEEPLTDEPRGVRAAGLEYGGAEHRRIWQRFVRATGRYERLFAEATTELFKRQLESILARLNAQRAEPALPDDWEPFSLIDWIRRFRDRIVAVYREIIVDAGAEALIELGLGMDFDIDDPSAKQFLEGRAQRFAEEVNQTTWANLQDSLSEGLDSGEGIKELSERVEEVMGDRIRSTPEVIARTEVIGAANGGTLEAWKQSKVVKAKTWLAALDDRTRDTHIEAHGQTVGIDEEFVVGGGRGPAPGQIGIAEEDIQCRCTMAAVIK